MRVFRLEVSVYNVYITNKFQITLGGGGGNPLVEVIVNSKEEALKTSFCPNYVSEFGLWLKLFQSL